MTYSIEKYFLILRIKLKLTRVTSKTKITVTWSLCLWHRVGEGRGAIMSLHRQMFWSWVMGWSIDEDRLKLATSVLLLLDNPVLELSNNSRRIEDVRFPNSSIRLTCDIKPFLSDSNLELLTQHIRWKMLNKESRVIGHISCQCASSSLL